MNSLLESLELIAKRKDSRRVIIVVTLLLLFLLIVVQNGGAAYAIFSFDSMPFTKQLYLFFVTLFNITSTFTASSLIVATLGSFLGGINLSLAYTYMKIRGEVILKSGLYSGIGLIAAFFGVGCAACGTALLSVILGFFGFSAMLNVLPYQGQEIGYIGIIFLSMATYFLAKKVTTPNVC